MAVTKKPVGRRRNLKEQQRRAQIKEAAINLFSAGRGGRRQQVPDLLVLDKQGRPAVRID